ncbi:isopeptide-forming domain-containing fimbrial protein [Bifidobacterium adolescentis]|uniref:isopeptide-forming domain-containing fimbrial protein n=1 Tax=Bifidobacterium adolescentis TaxID=1680 RepID=UPI0018A0AA08|nr:isopeptide-forming domain-containing fimbrial protein [Bifidobacterium adolescentis]MDB1493383.1 isopeptide-forming domain-containing fimbrial protein [Bifidobacterium adolescentis]
MNKVLKGLVAVAATAAMAVAGFAGASTAMAADPTGGIQVADGDTHTYSVYQILTGTYGANGALGNVQAGTDFKVTNAAGDQGKDLTAAEAAEKLAKIGSTESDQTKLAEILKFANLTTQYGSDLTASAPLTKVPAGYYLAKDKDDTVTGDDAQTLYIVKVVGNSAVTITRKVDKPTFQKKVKDVNDSTGDKSDWQDSADYDVNDKVPFQLTATLPTKEDDFAAYKTYKLVFTDNQSVGLTYPEATGFIVKYGETVVPTSQYTLTLNPTTTTAGSTFTLTINDVKSLKDADGSDIAVAAGGKFTVEYESTLNDKAVIGSNGNPNEASLKFSNNPNYTGTGEDSPTGETPKDKVIVFTYQLNVNKTFDQGTPADNDLPKFKLYKKTHGVSENDGYVQVGPEIEVTKTSDNKYIASFPRIDDGDYKLVESHTPAGYNTAADTLFTVTAEHDVSSDNPALTSLKINQTDGDKTTGTVQADVVNKKGSNLPSTGGMGTVLLYVAGIAVFVLAGATLVMALRRRNA